ncbi:hypothetical protein [Clostridium culturomicium]|uniref:hypothetical protein n=1 Tax=Clostridium culturomicium TaxID=1499683 RepID=UPI0038574347
MSKVIKLLKNNKLLAGAVLIVLIGVGIFTGEIVSTKNEAEAEEQSLLRKETEEQRLLAMKEKAVQQELKEQENKTSNDTTQVEIHTHNWQEVYEEVYYQEEGHYESILVSEGWMEKIPSYVSVTYGMCSLCKDDIEGRVEEHLNIHIQNGEEAQYVNGEKQVHEGHFEKYHPAQYENKWVVDRPARTESILSGYKCECGETK